MVKVARVKALLKGSLCCSSFWISGLLLQSTTIRDARSVKQDYTGRSTAWNWTTNNSIKLWPLWKFTSEKTPKFSVMNKPIRSYIQFFVWHWNSFTYMQSWEKNQDKKEKCRLTSYRRNPWSTPKEYCIPPNREIGGSFLNLTKSHTLQRILSWI